MKHETDYVIDVTIIIPHFNSLKKLLRLLNTIPAMENIEVIVVDDKSTNLSSDEFSAIQETLSKIKGRLLYNKTSKKGAGVCRNIALKCAKGNWLLFADADDFFLDGAKDVISSCINSCADIIFFPPISVNEKDFTPSYRHLEYERLCKDYINSNSARNLTRLKYNWNSPCSKLIRREMVVENGILFDEYPVANDVMFSMRTSFCANSIEAEQHQIYCITSDSGTLTAQKDKTFFELRVQIFIKRSQFLKERLSDEEYEYLDINGKNFIVMAIRRGYGLKEAIQINEMLTDGGVKPWQLKYLISDLKKLIKIFKDNKCDAR